VEPLVSRQWFVRVEPLARTAIEAVEDQRTIFTPPKYEKIYFEWMRNIHDWCISRQLWWGHRIPAWYCQECGEIMVAVETPDSCHHCGSSSLSQETDVLDTWFSSGLWPFSTLGWPEQTRDLEVYYPTTTMVTGFDIIFFWVARMMMMGLKFMNEVPFREVFINGLVRDEHGQKMSKSKGNVIDPLEIIDEYGTDAVRFTLSVLSVPGGDIPFSVSRMAGYRAFCNKIWNAARFLLLNIDLAAPVEKEEIRGLMEDGKLKLEDRWILSRLQEVIAETNRDIGRFYIHETSNNLYHFFWHEFCDWYIELIKTRINAEDEQDRSVSQKVALHVLDSSLRLLHPFIPFITEELWQKVPHNGETIMLCSYPEPSSDWIHEQDCKKMAKLQELISSVRTARAENNIDPRADVKLFLRCRNEFKKFIAEQEHHLSNLIKTEQIEYCDNLPTNSLQVQGGTSIAEFVIVLEGLIDLEAERSRLEKELEKTQKELANIGKKLQNQDFVEKAPREVVDKARKRHSEVLESVSAIKVRLDRLNR
jgi:valyl-tRNA synthetase